MPTYEYECKKCGKTFDIFQSMKDAPLTTCPKEHCCMKKWGCGTVKRKIGIGAGIIFKGSGFYQTDYRSDGYKAAEKKDTAPAPSSETKSDTKPDPKPEKKADKNEKTAKKSIS